MLRSVLSPVDFSEHSRQALRWAGEFAARCQSRLVVLGVVDPLLADAARIRLGLDLAETETAPALREFVAATWPDGLAPSAPPIIKTGIGEAGAVILEAAASEGADLVVLGTHGLGGFRKWLLGSTTERVLRRTPVPVLAVPPVGEQPDGASVEDRPFGLARILVTTDFSEPSAVAIQYAVQIAQQFSATLTLAHVVEPLTVPLRWQSLVQESDQARVDEAGARLKALAERFCGSRGCDTVVSVGRPADLIGVIAEDRRAHLIVMGLSGGHGPLAPRPGAIAYRVLCSTTVPVLVVPPATRVNG